MPPIWSKGSIPTLKTKKCSGCKIEKPICKFWTGTLCKLCLNRVTHYKYKTTSENRLLTRDKIIEILQEELLTAQERSTKVVSTQKNDCCKCGRWPLRCRRTHLCDSCSNEFNKKYGGQRSTIDDKGFAQYITQRLWQLRKKAKEDKEPFKITSREVITKFTTICEGCKRDVGLSIQIDHCHLTGELRGFLCFTCNACLGNVRDNPEILMNLSNYIKERQITNKDIK